MFDFDKFYAGLLARTNYFDNYWEQFPSGKFLFKDKTLRLLKLNAEEKDAHGLANTLAVICRDGADSDYTAILLSLLDENWQRSEEDIVSVLEMVRDPNSVEKLYEVALNVPDYDDMRALAKKSMWALSAIGTPEAIQKLRRLACSTDPIIRENAIFQLEQVVKSS